MRKRSYGGGEKVNIATWGSIGGGKMTVNAVSVKITAAWVKAESTAAGDARWSPLGNSGCDGFSRSPLL